MLARLTLRLGAAILLALSAAARLQAQQDTTPARSSPTVDDLRARRDALLVRLGATLATVDSLEAGLRPDVPPGTGSSVPSAFGLLGGRIGFGMGLQERARYSGRADGALTLLVGLGDPSRLGVDVGVSVLDLRKNAAGRGGLGRRGSFKLKLHRRIPGGAVALGVDNVPGWGGSDAPASVYGLVAGTCDVTGARDGRTGEVYLSLGAGTGRFRPEDDVRHHRTTVGVLANGALRVHEQANLFVEWTGQDLGVGASLVPLRSVPLVLAPAVADLTGSAGDGVRFVVSVGYLLPFQRFLSGR
jgi:hypothetical protein